MIRRQTAMKLFAEKASEKLKIVSCLGRISRDLFSFTSISSRYDCFYIVGAMGSTLPFSIGFALCRPELQVYAIEGDGSVLMNLGGLVTFQRYKPANLSLWIMDNRQYETTGGQSSQPEGFELSAVCTAIGLQCNSIARVEELENMLTDKSLRLPEVCVIKTQPDSLSPRITESPEFLAYNFKNQLC